MKKEFNPQKNEKDAEKKLRRRISSYIDQVSRPILVKLGRTVGVRIPKILWKYDKRENDTKLF